MVCMIYSTRLLWVGSVLYAIYMQILHNLSHIIIYTVDRQIMICTTEV